MTGKKPIVVMKYGGISLERASSVRRILSSISQRKESAFLVLVFSAAGKTTRQLLTCAREAAGGNTACFHAQLQSIFAQHTALAADFISEKNDSDVSRLLDRYYQDLSRLMHGLSETGELTPRLQDQILSYGELMSTGLMSGILTVSGIANRLLHAPDLIITDDTHSAAEPIQEISYPRIREAVTAAFADGDIPVIQGFIGSTREGIPTTLGFEGSDYTAALIADACAASALEVWKNVDGVMSADPQLCPRAEIIPFLSYERASVLCTLGARVLHPKTLAPVRNASIPVHVKPLERPESPGTVIRASADEDRFLAVTHRANASLVRVAIAVKASPSRALQSISDWLEHSLLRPLFLGLDGNSVLVAVDTDTTVLPHCYALDEIGTLQAVEPIGTVSIIGHGLYHARVMEQLFTALRSTYICFVSQGVHPESVTIGVRRSDVEATVVTIHDCLVLAERGSL